MSSWQRLTGPSFVTFFIFVTLLLADASNAISIYDCCTNAQDATSFALIYGNPLPSFAKLAFALLYVLKAPNKPYPMPSLSTPSSTTVVAPNVDTLYTIAIIDLSHTDVVVTVPHIENSRYWSFAFYDPYGNEFATVSDVEHSPNGTYLLRRADDANVNPGIQLPPPAGASYSKYQGIVNYPTNYGIMLNRILVRHNTTEELHHLNKLQDQIMVKEIPRIMHQPGASPVPRLTMDYIRAGDESKELIELRLLAKLAPYNQPINQTDRYRVAGILGLAGLAPIGGVYKTPAGVDLDAASKNANGTIASASTNPANINLLGNDWAIQYPDLQGNFGTHYAFRARVAQIGYLELPETEALYPSYVPEGSGDVPLGPRSAYLLTFSAPPPLKQSGFWSLTLYGPTGELVPNALGRYTVGDRSNLTYADGTPVYGEGAPAKGGRFQVLVQPADVAPPRNWTSNWLPGPAGGGASRFFLRLYAPTPALSNHSYVYPKVQKIDAIT